MIGLCIGLPKCAVANSKSPRSKLISACNNIKRRCFRCENLSQIVNAADVVHDSPPPCNQPIPLLNTNVPANIVAQVFVDFLFAVRCFKTLLESPLSSPRSACHTSSAHVAAELFAQGSSSRCFGSPNAFKHSHQRHNDMTSFWYVSLLQENVAQGRFVYAPGNSRGNLNTAHQTSCSVWCMSFSWR